MAVKAHNTTPLVEEDGQGGHVPLVTLAPGAAVGIAGGGKWGALGAPVTLIAGTQLNGLANNSNKLAAAAYDNGDAANRYQLAKVTLDVRGASSFTAGTFVRVWLLALTRNGTDYEDGSDSVTPARDPDIEFALRAVNTQQRIVEAVAVLPPGPFKALVRNEGGQAFTASDTENVLTLEPYTEVFA